MSYFVEPTVQKYSVYDQIEKRQAADLQHSIKCMVVLLEKLKFTEVSFFISLD